MIYSVTARFTDQKIRGLYQKLMDGSIYSQRPDGKAIYFAMKRAKIIETGVAKWTELCYCPSPLEHEKATVFKHFFDSIETEEVDYYKVFQGTSLIEHLKQLNY
jgi:hypothetical protein